MKLSLRARILLAALAVVVVPIVSSGWFLVRQLEASLVEQIRDDLFVRVDLLAERAHAFAAPMVPGVEWDGFAEELGRRAQGRVTVIRADGVVLGDSGVEIAALGAVENHGTRPEVVQALAEGRGSDLRVSQTVHRRLMYVAVPLTAEGGSRGVMRLALPLDAVDRAVADLRRVVLLAGLVELLLAFGLAAILVRGLTRSITTVTDTALRLADGDLGARTGARGEDELARTGRALDQLASSLQRTLNELRAERDLFGRVLQEMREGVLVVERDGRIALVNAALREMLLLPGDVAGRRVAEVLEHPELAQALDQSRTAAGPASLEVELGDLRPRRLTVTTAPLQGDPGGVVAVVVDVTEIRRLESLRRDFVANVSHELRTPVAAVIAAAETLQAMTVGGGPAVKEFMDIIDRNAQRLHRILEDLLDLSRLESRAFNFRIEEFALEPLVRHVFALLAASADAKTIRLVADVPPPGEVRADRRAVEHVLVNLLENAIKYCPVGARVTVSVAAEGQSLRVAVADTGPGIEERHLPRLFERFYRVDAGRSRDVGGTGLGLSIVKHMVEAMGGGVAVESTVGRGTTFSFTLPRA